MSSSQTVIENLVNKPNAKKAQHIIHDAALESAASKGVWGTIKKVMSPSFGQTQESIAWNLRLAKKNDEKIKAKQAKRS